MSKTMRDDAIEHDTSPNMNRPPYQGRRQRAGELLGAGDRLGDTLLVGDCAHDNLNAAGDRCLSCGMWAHEMVRLPVGTA